MTPPSGRKRRRHSEAFKAQVIEACLQPGVSAAAVALANQINANMLRTWVREYRSQQGNRIPAEVTSRSDPTTTTLVPVQVEAPAAPTAADIQIEIRQSRRVVQVNWPMSEASRCALWLKEFLG